MWEIVDDLRAAGTTIILTTHYIEEAEAIADRIAVINGGRILLVEDKARLMQPDGPEADDDRAARRRSTRVPEALAPYRLELGDDGGSLTYAYDRGAERTGIVSLLRDVSDAGLALARRADPAEVARGHLRRPGEGGGMNWQAIRAIYGFEMARTFRTILQSLVAPVISTSLYFVVFGTAIGSRIEEVEGVEYGAFIVPGLIMLTVLMQSVSNASFGIYFPKFIGTIYELLSAPISFLEIVIGYVGAAATKSFIIGLIIYADRQPLRDPAGRAPAGDARLSRAHLHQLQPLRLHHRHLGEELRAAPARAAPHRSRRSSSSAAPSTRSRCCRRPGRRSPSSTRSST